MKLRMRLAAAILLPVTVTVVAVVTLVMVLSATSNIASVETTLADRQEEMIGVLTEQFAGSVRFGKMDTVEAAFTSYSADPDFGLAAAGAVSAQGDVLLEYGSNPELITDSLAVATQALAEERLVAVTAGDFHIAAHPAYFGKELELVGAVVMTWDLSIHRGPIIAGQLRNGLIALGIAAAAIAALALFLVRHVTGPMRSLTRASTALAEGQLEVEVAGAARQDELGDMARAVEVFRANSLRVRQMTDAEAARITADQASRQQMMLELQEAFGQVVDAAVAGDYTQRVTASFDDAELNTLARGVNDLVETVDRGLGEAGEVLAALAEADLTQRVRGEYQGAFARLKTDTNRVAESLSEIVARLKQTSFSLKTATGEILAGANDLSDRTTRQAATIEETSAAMEQLATTVLQNADRAADASTNAGKVTQAAEEGGEVMQQATDAMERITTSSGKISNIIGLIDDIAFQTNLLALNASVEAARAGEAGKGFAVVAVEVRRLAQSAAEASSEVKALIEQSGTEVAGGSKLVASAADKLVAMLEAARRNNQLLESIAQESREQASAIEEVNSAVRQLDEMTQHNAALVEETNAAIEQTEAQAGDLDQIVALFRTEQAGEPAVAPSRGVAALQQKVKAAAGTYLSRGSAALKEDWSEF
ncbi:MAG TPA: methyl-accepting chemotaxis protein [Devosiaceae bacterium]|jgi:methyl-accepting chemotaxis protein|nr:methyl-accepting chemotaxis protein [Devosiaceae bacterium]